MQCKNHPDKQATQFCAACEMPLCDDCAEENEPGRYYCFKCAMITSVSAVGASIRDKKERAADGRAKEKKKLTAFHYFVIITSALILVMWGFILLGGEEFPESESNVDFARNTRVLLFMVDGVIKDYAHTKGNGYPDTLHELPQDYLSTDLKKFLDSHPDLLSYKRDPETGYKLVLRESEDMHIVISADRIQYEVPKEKEA